MPRQIFIMIKKAILIFVVFIFYISPVYAVQCDPFTISCRNTNEILTKYPLSALSMAGVINKENQIWAIIKAPDQHVYPVSIGGSIGLGGGKVIHITSQQIIVEQQKKSVTIWLR